MPLRGLFYFAKLYNKLIDLRGLDIYGTAPLELPLPRYFVLYFGMYAHPVREIMRLSDLFLDNHGKKVQADLEVTATVLNCNEGYASAIMRECSALQGYAHLIALVRANRVAGEELGEAVQHAVDCCIKEGMLTDYLQGHRSEAIEMLWTIEDEERAMRVHWETVAREAAERGKAEGKAEGIAEGMARGMAEGRKEVIDLMRSLGADESLIAQAEAL